MLSYLVATVIILCVLHIVMNYNETARMLKKIPGMKDRFIVGNALDIWLPPVELMGLGRILAKQFNGIYRFWAFPIGVVALYNPQDIEILLSGMKHGEKSITYNILRPWLRNGLLVSHGAKWQQRRKILTPAFHFNILRQFCVILEENSRRLVESLESKTGVPINVEPLLSEYTLHSICETAMGTRLNEETTGAGRTYKQALYEIGKLFVERFSKIYYMSDALYSLSISGRKLKHYLQIVHKFTRKVIDDRKEYLSKYKAHEIGSHFDDNGNDDTTLFNTKKKKTAMLDLLIAAEKDGLIDNKGIQEEVDTFMFEGHDTTASGLVFCMMSLANEQEIQEKIVEELYTIFGDSDRVADIEDLTKMKYLECCIKESLRLYPPVHFMGRKLSETVKLSNYTVPAGTTCNIFVLDLHRREDLYKNPLVFDPERFLPENSVGRHPYAYIPFSAGPRNCIGQKFAMLEMKSALSAVLRKYKLLPVTKPSEIQFTADLVLRNSGPVNVIFEKRNLK